MTEQAAWTPARVLALAADPASARAAEAVARPGSWAATGRGSSAVWGSCRGSGPTPYRTLVDLTDDASPRFRCSCPSRKVPCKHALALLLLAASGLVPEGQEPPEDVTAWLADPGKRRPGRPRRVPTGPSPERVERVRLGLEELDTWLADQVHDGLATLQRGGYRAVDQVAARMVDAQAPGVAGMVRALPGRMVGEDWPARTLEHLASIRLLVAAHRRLAELPSDLADTVRSRVGYPVAKESVLAWPPVRDRWAVLALVDLPDYQLTTRRVWLRGTETGRWALLLSFAVGDAGLDSSAVPGTTMEADLHFYPGSGQLRGLLGDVRERVEDLADLDGLDVTEAAEAFADLLALDPWAERMPVLLTGAPLPPEERRPTWLWRDERGATVPLVRGAEAWPLVARSMGDPIEVVGEWTRSGFWPLSSLPHALDPAFTAEVLAS